jgi:hypothetical protein
MTSSIAEMTESIAEMIYSIEEMTSAHSAERQASGRKTRAIVTGG